MNDFLNNGITQAIIATLICGGIFGAFKWFSFKKDENTILSFLKTSSRDSDFTFRFEHSIASETNLSEERIHNVCSKSKKITRNKKEKKSWRLAGSYTFI